MKQCKQCQEFKELTEFHPCGNYKNKIYYRGECSDCTRKNQASPEYRAKEREYRKTSEKYKNKRREYRNKPEVREKERAYDKEHYPKVKAKKSARHLERYHNDIMYRIAFLCRKRTREVLKAKSWNKSNKFKQYIGCDLETLKAHIEAQFQPGMSWENQGRGSNKWHIDHIIPLDSANNEQELYKLCHYTNLQPLWEVDNLKKSNKITK